ncbi:FecCD family ABC transporter permease [Pyrococcus abyssi]|uniref:Ferrichrome transport system permease protein (ABC) n=1 Tax=Pyrococcus abyssi (strain GE5 / Orsay) TaxID=272844 RepID=Q9UZY7_PYRAB|nr:iron ABC transporter permease [Pyrococcus abyssi]CAB49919.1 Ferrichrome transport system permease protein (ABC) [Pyrococcus abyssi GE5]CCE70417.1 TPA: iron (III) ABC transporter, permease protein [Pyrococcus abyssi GE5]
MYEEYVKKRMTAIFILSLLLIFVALFSLTKGAYPISTKDAILALFNKGNPSARQAVWSIRLPRIVASILVGASLALGGAVLQGILKNPLATPFTMGVSHGAMFGASLAILLGAGYAESSGRVSIDNPYAIVAFAFAGAMTSTVIIVALAKLKGLSPQAMVLAGVAMSSLFVALTTLIQYIANELQLAAMVYWSFGDLGRPYWTENWIMFISLLPILAFFLLKRWDLNASSLGDEVALSVGVEVEKFRLISAILSAYLTAVTVAFVGVIGFVGLIAPHVVRLIFGGDYRFLIPLSALLGSLILLTADTFARLAFSPMILPVGVVTSFLGAPMFLYLLLKMEGRV